MKLFIFSLLLVPMISSAGVAEEMVLPSGMKRGDCSPCTLKDKEKGNFNFSATIDSKRKYITSIEINGKEFNVGSDLEIYSDTYPPFYQVEFKGNTKYELYGLQAKAAASNLSYHYFLKQGSEFHYLGQYPELQYIAKQDRFVSILKGLEGGSRTILKLNSDQKKFVVVSKGK